jgi:sulfate adenylyltransferase (ADP) / ATP adenylyltransferase
MTFKTGTLWALIVRTSEHALRNKKLLPVPTEYIYIEDGGIQFLVRILTNIARKQHETAAGAGKNANPFLPPEKELIIADISPTHLAVLNKFNVLKHHLLIITRQFEAQEMLLTPNDFLALWLCMAEFNGLAFYNGGRTGGASQNHKHIQIVPLPITPDGPAIPVEPLLRQSRANQISDVHRFPFLNSFVRLDQNLVSSPTEAAKKIFDLYSTMLSRVGITAPSASRSTRQSMPYCFLITRQWMLLVPRSQDSFDGISLNSLAFAGSLFVHNERQLEKLKDYGPMKALASVAILKYD